MADKESRKLTEKEQRRKELIDKVIEHKETEGYRRTDITISIVKANAVAIVAGAIFAILAVVLYIKIYGNYALDYDWKLAIFTIASFVIHELIHGLFWGIFASNHFGSVEFGFIAEMLTPYCTCLEPLKKYQYIIGCAMPGVILGVFPLIVGYAIGSAGFLFYGVILFIGAVGDIMIICKLLSFKTTASDVIFLDHPTECGLIALEKIDD